MNVMGLRKTLSCTIIKKFEKQKKAEKIARELNGQKVENRRENQPKGRGASKNYS